MAISEQSRHRLHQALDRVLGPDEAAILMEHLPPVGWADVATKRDLDQLSLLTRRDLDEFSAATKRELDHLESRLTARLEREMRLQTWRLVTIMIALMGAVVAAVRL